MNYLESNGEYKVDLGCGNNKKNGFVGVDIVETEDADIVADLKKENWLFADKNSCRYATLVNVLEHFNQSELDNAVQELSRIVEKGGIVEIVVPHYLSSNAAAGDHKKYFSSVGFDCYTVNHDYPTPKPQVFKKLKLEFKMSDRKFIKCLRCFLPDGVVRNFVPNAVDELRFFFEVVENGSFKR